MLFGDEEFMDLGHLLNPTVCEAVSLKDSISLDDIWVPSKLLVNRKIAIDSNQNPFNIFRTLERIEVKSLSTYTEGSKQDLSYEQLQVKEFVNTCQTELKSSLLTSNEKSSEELYYSDDNNKEDCDNNAEIPKFFHEVNKKKLFTKNSSFEKYSNEVLTKPSVSHKEYESSEFLLDLINDEQLLQTDSSDILHSDISESFTTYQIADEECDLIDDQNETVEVLKFTSDTPKFEDYEDKQNILCSEYINKPLTEYQDQPNSHQCSKIEELSDNVKTKQKIYNDSIAECHEEAVSKLVTAHHNSENEELLNPEQPLSDNIMTEDTVETVIELPIPYQRPVLEQTTKKRQKGKKKKEGKNKNMQFKDFLQIDDGYEVPQKDEFYENLVRRGLCVPKESQSSIESTINKSLNAQYFGVAKKNSIHEEQSLKALPNTCSASLSEPTVMDSTVEENSLSVQKKLGPENEGPAIVLENISKDVTAENIKSILSNYAEVGGLSLKADGKFVKVKAKLNIEDDDVDWIVEGLNGSEPFGASGGVIKCYRI